MEAGGARAEAASRRIEPPAASEGVSRPCRALDDVWTPARAVARDGRPADGPAKAAGRGTGTPAVRMSRAASPGLLTDTRKDAGSRQAPLVWDSRG
ncbi:hypothetical protein [Streptomyces sp. 8L]|uniref:hypothetical protein n=1 Tax=Streptomyces sp. 8L TaxID=2877242 RepID=UPI001CD56483|nr:hypothetical protein [Streptomyces sp. 8L]MCA1218062.1 hypothetical protein [Streptomyces sp. 8L]